MLTNLTLEFAVRKLGDTFFLGIQITSHGSGLFLDQKKYNIDFLRNSHFLKSSNTPMKTNQELWLDAESIVEATDHRRIVDTLQYFILS